MRRRFLVSLSLGAFLLLGGGAAAHEMRPALLELRERDDHRWEMTWKVPARGADMRLSLDVRLPEGFEWESLPSRAFVGDAFVDRGVFQIPGGLNGREIYIEGLLSTFTDAMVQIERLDGTLQTARLEPSDPSLVVEERPSPSEIPRFYFREGIVYMKGGWDHAAMIVVLGLVCLASHRRGPGRFLVIAVAFLAGSIGSALVAVTTGWAPPSTWTEVMTALSLIPPALVVARGNKDGMIGRLPAMMGLLAGLIHGFSMARVFLLSAQEALHRADALLAFLGGIAVVLMAIAVGFLVVALLAGAKSRKEGRPVVGAVAAAYVIGTAGVVWTLERIG